LCYGCAPVSLDAISLLTNPARRAVRTRRTPVACWTAVAPRTARTRRTGPRQAPQCEPGAACRTWLSWYRGVRRPL